MIQEPENRTFLTARGTWSTDFNEALEFSSIRETLEHKHRLNLEHAAVLVFRGKCVYRLEESKMIPVCPDLAGSDEQPDFIPIR